MQNPARPGCGSRARPLSPALHLLSGTGRPETRPAARRGFSDPSIARRGFDWKTPARARTGCGNRPRPAGWPRAMRRSDRRTHLSTRPPVASYGRLAASLAMARSRVVFTTVFTTGLLPDSRLTLPHFSAFSRNRTRGFAKGGGEAKIPHSDSVFCGFLTVTLDCLKILAS